MSQLGRPRFITLTGEDGTPIRINAALVCGYCRSERPIITYVRVSEQVWWVQETPEQIDRMIEAEYD